MIKKLSTYFFITVIAIIIGYVLAITFKNLLKTYTKVKENNKKINFLENINKNENIPSLCFQSVYELAKKTNTKLPEILPLGNIPLKNKSKFIDFDRYGFRNNDNAWKKNNHDFLILGDSVVADNNIPDEYIFSNNFKKKSTINLGCGGNGLLTSLSLIEQISQTNYDFKNILIFLNFDNDFSKDTIREYNSQLFLQDYNIHSKNIFLNQNKYKKDYLNFVRDAFSKEISDFSLEKELYSQFNIEMYIKKILKLKKTNEKSNIALQDGTIVDSSLIPEGFLNVEMYNIFLNILERLSGIQQNRNTNITFVLVPTINELNAYNSNRKNLKEWKKYLYYKYFKNIVVSTSANFKISIIDLYYFIKENNYKGFKNGHFKKDYHKRLSIYINDNINNKTNKLLEKLYYYNSFFPSKEYFNYQANFGNKLNKTEVNNWINIINTLMKKNLIDNYLLTPSLGYFYINQDCDSILRLYKLSNAKLISFSVGSFFYETCNLKNTDNINESIKEINFLIDKDVKYYIPIISKEMKRSLKLIDAN